VRTECAGRIRELVETSGLNDEEIVDKLEGNGRPKVRNFAPNLGPPIDTFAAVIP